MNKLGSSMRYPLTFLYITLAILAVLLLKAWNDERPHTPITPVSNEVVFEHGRTEVPDIIAEPAKADDIPVQAGFSTQVPHSEHVAAVSGQRVDVKTDVMEVVIDTLGGNLVDLKLLNYPQTMENPNIPVQLLQNSAQHIYVAQSGLKGPAGPDKHQQVQYFTASNQYVMKKDDKQMTVDLSWRSDAGVKVTKRFVFKPGQYLVDVYYLIDNQSNKTWTGQFYSQLKRQRTDTPRVGVFAFPTYLGGALSSPEKRFEKVSFDDMATSNVDRSVTGGWAAMIQHYFVSAWIPEAAASYRYYSRKGSNETYWLGMVGPTLNVEPGSVKSVHARFYSGPAKATTLKTIAPGLELTVDYGWLWPISQLLFWILRHIHSLVFNWGVSIILVTLLIKIVFYPLSAASYRSMAKMRTIQPKIKALQERYSGDKQKMSQGMIDLYKKEKINPLGGCLPILIQIPVFIALYWVLIESVELRQAPFFAWIQDLSAKDPYYVLPLLMGLTMFLQQKMSPSPPDPVQAKIFLLMPVVFTVLFMSFPAGLMLYWVANNTLSIAQQWFITKNMAKPGQR